MLTTVLFLLVFGIYAIWDSEQTAAQSLPGEYEIYKPEPWDGPTYPDLKDVNPDVIGWITIYGTNIDYPLVQGDDNEKYVKTSADGTYSLGGAIFLDTRNTPDLSDFNNIIYGHSMAYNAMFGDISDFLDADFFAEHRTGDIFIGEKHKGLQILAILETDAYKSGLYHIPLADNEEKTAYVEEISEEAVHTAGGDVTGWDDFYSGSLTGSGVPAGKIGSYEIGADDSLAVLSTCTYRMTNGRHILICRITDETYEDPYMAEPPRRLRINHDAVGPANGNTRTLWIIMMIIFALLAAIIVTGRANRKKAAAAKAAIKEDTNQKDDAGPKGDAECRENAEPRGNAKTDPEEPLPDDSTTRPEDERES